MLDIAHSTDVQGGRLGLVHVSLLLHLSSYVQEPDQPHLSGSGL